MITNIANAAVKVVPLTIFRVIGMRGERLSMRKIREVLRLWLGQRLSQRAIADSLGLSLGAVHGYLRQARCAGPAATGWPQRPVTGGAAVSAAAERAARQGPLNQMWRHVHDHRNRWSRSAGSAVRHQWNVHLAMWHRRTALAGPSPPQRAKADTAQMIRRPGSLLPLERVMYFSVAVA